MRTQWESRFGSALPLGWSLRGMIPGRWVRIHSLPDSRRYPENQEDRGLLLRRHSAVADAVLGRGARCLLYVPRYLAPDEPSGPVKLLSLEDLVFESWQVKAPDFECSIHSASAFWDAGKFEPTLLSVAEGTERVLFLSLDTEQIYAPYDGGADLFLQSESQVREVRTRFAAWLSARLDGR